MLEEKGRGQHCWHLIWKSLSLYKGKGKGGCPLLRFEVHAGGDAQGLKASAPIVAGHHNLMGFPEWAISHPALNQQ